MRRPGSGADRRIGGMRTGSVRQQPLMDWAVGGTFSRGSVATTRAQNDSVLYRVGANDRRFQNGRFFCETSGTDQARYSEQLDAASWVKTNCTITANTTTAPDGSLTADTIVTTSGGVATSVALTSVGTPAAWSSFQFWVRTDESSFTGSYTYAGTSSVSADFIATNTWQRISNLTSSTTAPTLTIRPHDGAGTGTAGRTMQVWGGYLQSSATTGSYFTIEGISVTRAADSLTYAAGAWDTRLATANYQFEYVPDNASSATAAVADLLSFGGGNDRIAMSNADSIQVIVGGVTYAASSVLTWNRDSVLTITVRPVTGVCTVSGALTGNGNFGSTPWAWPTAVTLRVGGRVSSTAEMNGAMSNPFLI